MLYQPSLVITRIVNALQRVLSPSIREPWAVCQITRQVLGDRLLIPLLITGASYTRPEAFCTVNIANRPNGERVAGTT